MDIPEDLKSFIEKVRQMRENQKNYFRTRHSFYLMASRMLEKEVDAALDRLGNNLFPEQ